MSAYHILIDRQYGARLPHECRFSIPQPRSRGPCRARLDGALDKAVQLRKAPIGCAATAMDERRTLVIKRADRDEPMRRSRGAS